MTLRSLRRALPVLALLAASLRGEETPVLVVVPPGADFALLQAVRSAIPPTRTALLVGEKARVRVGPSLELQLDRTFVEAPPADVVVVLPGEAPGLAEFLAARREQTAAFLFLGDSALVSRLKADGKGAIVLIGGPEAIAPLLATLPKSRPGDAAARPATSAPTPVSSPSPTPTSGPSRAVAPAPSPSAGTFDRYFSGPTPTPTPRR
jgi:hypothetical protein